MMQAEVKITHAKQKLGVLSNKRMTKLLMLEESNDHLQQVMGEKHKLVKSRRDLEVQMETAQIKWI